MSSIRLFKLVAAAALIGFLGCATQAADVGSANEPSGKGGEPKTPNLENVIFKFEKGRLIPYTKDGVPYLSCGNDRRNDCALYRKGVTITELEVITILSAKSKASPECQTIEVVMFGSVMRFDDPACKKK